MSHPIRQVASNIVTSTVAPLPERAWRSKAARIAFVQYIPAAVSAVGIRF